MRYSLSVRLAASTVFHGGVIAYPTEGVFGLGCDPFNADAVGRILRIKQRPVSKGLILIADSLERFLPFMAPMTTEQTNQMTNSWPGSTTWVVPHNGTLPNWVTGGRDTVAIRVPGHPLARAICADLKMPLTSTSANRHQRPALFRQLNVQQQLANDVDYIVPGRVQNPGRASTIQDLVSGAVYR